MATCWICSSTVRSLIDFGPQPICNRFPAARDAEEARFPLHLGQCEACGLVQLLGFPPADELRPRVDWITYNEAEGHLDEVADAILPLLQGRPDPSVLGLSYKDASLVERLRKRGIADSRVIALPDLGVEGPGAGVETIQQAFTDHAADVRQAYGPADLVVARHILEHAHRIGDFVQALKSLLKPGGLILLEVPDASLALETFDYSTVWEEHSVYFTPPTFAQSQAVLGLEPRYSALFPYPLENSLVSVAAVTDPRPVQPQEWLPAALDQAARYRDNFEPRKAAVRKAVSDAAGPGEHVAMFGAGHLACKFINFFELADRIPFVIDDHPRKQGLFMPGSRLPIRDSSTLQDPALRLCLTSLNPESEARMRRNHSAYMESGGRFASIFPASPNALLGDRP